MKLTKKLAAIAACACMAMTSMVGMGASAAENHNDLRMVKIAELGEATSNPVFNGTYTNQSDYSSFITLSSTRCNLEKVYCGTLGKKVRGETDTYDTGNNDENSPFTASVSGKFLVENGSQWTVSDLSNELISGSLYAVKNFWNVIQYYVIKIDDGGTHEQVFVQDH